MKEQIDINNKIKKQINYINVSKQEKNIVGSCNACDYDSHNYSVVKEITISQLIFRLCYKCVKKLKSKL